MNKFLKISILCALAFTMTSMRMHQTVQIGDKAPDFNLKNVDGTMKSPADYKDAKGLIIVFTCNHCPFSQIYESRIIELHNKYAPKGYPVVAINPNDPVIEPDDSYAEMQKRARSMKYPFDYLVDETQMTAKAYGAARTPHVFIVEKKPSANVIRYIGAIDDNADNAAAANNRYVELAVESLLAGKEVTMPETKAIGCTVKWKKTQ
jgi:peroxiredoxin